MSHTQLSIAADQFGPRASAYVTSVVHSLGEDLNHVAQVAERLAGGRMLDLGCGGGHVSYRMAPHASEVTAYDLSADMLAEVARTAQSRGMDNIVTSQGAAERLNFPDASYDLVVTRFSTHHWRDFAAGLREARRVLKPGGEALFIDAVSPGRALPDTLLQTMEMLRDPSHVRDYTPAEWLAALAAAGFTQPATTPRRLRMDFPSWIERMATPDLQAQAILALQRRMPADIKQALEIEPDGSFMLDCMTFQVQPG